MKHLLIVFHSQSARNQQLALCLYHTAKRHAEVEVQLLNAFEANAEHWLWSDAFILCCPENFAQIAGGMKQFLDRLYYPVLDAQETGSHQAKPYCLVIDTGNDGSQCELHIHKILKGLRAKPVQDTVFIYGEPKRQDIELMQSMGEGFTEALSMGVI